MYRPLNNLREKIVTIAHKAKEGHIGSSLSILDILWVLYDKYYGLDDNVIVLSKGHAALGLYVVLNEKGLINDRDLNSFCEYASILGGHPDKNKIEHVYASTGSLGHGFPIALGVAMAKKIKKEKGKVYVIIGDGESNEGTIWESALLAREHNLDNLVCIVDHNHSNDRSLKLGDVVAKFSSFGWSAVGINGHSHNEIKNTLEALDREPPRGARRRPTAIIANTVKGNGIKRMENQHEWHHKFPNDEEYNEIIEEIAT